MNVELEYRARPVTRYIVTRFTSPEANSGKENVLASVETRGEYDNEEIAYAVAYALCKREHEVLGWPVGDERVQYPVTPETKKLAEIPSEG